MFKIIRAMSILGIALLLAATGCSTAPSSSSGRSELLDDSRNAIAMFRNSDPTIERFFNNSAGYAVFPTIAKGGLVLGGAHGRGALFENGVFTSYCDVTQGTIGLQIGGQGFSEIIFFENQEALNDFKDGTMSFVAEVSAVAAKYGAAEEVDYANGVAVFVDDQVGLMAEAAVGGQKFSVVSANDPQFAGDTNRENHNVYGYANGSDPAWKHDSDYNRMYATGQTKTIDGEVISMSDLYPTRDSAKGRQLTLRASDNQIYTVHLGPVSYLDQSNNMRIREGDRLTIVGSYTTWDGQQVLIAREVSGRDNQRLELRDNSGRSRWNNNLIP